MEQIYNKEYIDLTNTEYFVLLITDVTLHLSINIQFRYKLFPFRNQCYRLPETEKSRSRCRVKTNEKAVSLPPHFGRRFTEKFIIWRSDIPFQTWICIKDYPGNLNR